MTSKANLRPEDAGPPARGHASDSPEEGTAIAERSSQTRRPGSLGAVSQVAERYALPGLVVLLIAFFALLPASSGTFMSVTNWQNILSSQAPTLIVSFAALIPLIAGEFDVSVGANAGGACYLAAVLMAEGHLSIWLSIVITLAAGGVLGVVNGFIVAYIKASSLVVTLGMSTLIGGLILLISKSGQVVTDLPPSVGSFGSDKLVGIPVLAILFVGVGLAVSYLLRYTVLGRRLLFVGSNVRASRLAGIRTEHVKFVSFVICGILASGAGVVLLAQSGSADPTVGSGYLFSALAAVFLGATTIYPGRFNVPGTVVGVFFVAISVNGLTLAGAAYWISPVFNGASLVIAVVLSTLLRRQQSGAASG